MKLPITQSALNEFCRKNHIKKLALFGSVLHGNERPDSDIDILVEFEDGFAPGLRFFSMSEDLGAILGRKVDLNTPAFLSKYFRDQVLAEAEVQYVA